MPGSPDTSLGFLRKLRPVRQPRSAGAPERFFFRINDVNGLPITLDTVSSEGKHVDVDPGDFDGPVHSLLKSMASVRGAVDVAAGWGMPTASDDAGTGINLASNPTLLYQLTLCDNIVDSAMKRITVCHDTARVTLALTEQAEAAKATITPALTLTCGDMTTGLFTLLSDSFALADRKIYPIRQLGDNFSQLGVFLQPFDAGLLEAYLSVLFTYVPEIGLDYNGYTVERGKEPIDVEPTLVIEKLGADKALYLRLSQGAPGRLSAMVENLGVTVSATVSSRGKIKLRPIRQFDMAEKSEALYNEIKKYAPTRSDARDVYHDGNGFYIVPEATAAPFLFGGLPSLLSRYNIVGTDKLREYKLTPVAPKVNLRLSSGIDFLEGEATVDLGTETLTLAELLRQYSANHYVSLSDGSHGIIDPAYIRRLERIFKPTGKKDGKIAISFFDLPEVAELMGERVADNEAFARPRAFYTGFNTISAGQLTLPDVKATLRPYQIYGVKWLMYLYQNQLGGCLADDMGLGKTLQTIAFITKVCPGATRPTLIVMPRSLLFNWQAEFARFAPHIGVHVYYGQSRDLTEALKSEIILTTYALVRNDIELLCKEKFHMVILDESQNIKNISTGVTKSVHLLDAEHRFALSGTPIENNLMELYSLFRFLNPAMFGSADDFTRRYAAPIQQSDDTEALADLRRRIFPFMLRRLKSEVLSELPDRIDTTLLVDMDTAQTRLYEQRRTFYRERVQQSIAADGLSKSHAVMFQALNELRRIASVPESLTDGRVPSAKLDVLSEHISEAVANGHKSVVFFNFIAGIEIIGERLEREGIDYACMTGSTTDRRSVVERFQTDPVCRVLLMTLKTGGVGLNLTAADTVFIVEPWWNKAAEEQAVNRLHRFGQTAKVSCYSLITRGTIEEKIRELQQQKADLFREVITSDSTRSKQLTEDDINFILS